MPPATRSKVRRTADGLVLDLATLTEWRAWTPELFDVIRTGYFDDALDLLAQAVEARKSTLAPKSKPSKPAPTAAPLPPVTGTALSAQEMSALAAAGKIKVGSVLWSGSEVYPQLLRGRSWRVVGKVKGNQSVRVKATPETAAALLGRKWATATIRFPFKYLDGSKVQL